MTLTAMLFRYLSKYRLAYLSPFSFECNLIKMYNWYVTKYSHCHCKRPICITLPKLSWTLTVHYWNEILINGILILILNLNDKNLNINNIISILTGCRWKIANEFNSIKLAYTYCIQTGEWLAFPLNKAQLLLSLRLKRFFRNDRNVSNRISQHLIYKFHLRNWTFQWRLPSALILHECLAMTIGNMVPRRKSRDHEQGWRIVSLHSHFWSVSGGTWITIPERKQSGNSTMSIYE